MEKLLENFRQWAAQESDRRVVDWPLMSSPLPTFAICAAFLITAKLLHIWMKPRKAIDIRWPIWCFDFFHLAISSSLICFLIGLKVFDGANFRCDPLDDSPRGDSTVKLVWWYFLYNFTFFSEIFIFILGKRHDRITNYFLFHHIALPLSIWWIVRFCPTGHSLFFGLINCSVHVISFGYLALIGAFPGLRKHFGWWRMFFYTLLVVRIVLIVLHAFQLFLWNTCSYPMVYPLIVLINSPFFIVLTVSDHLLSDRKRRNRREYFVGRHDPSNP